MRHTICLSLLLLCATPALAQVNKEELAKQHFVQGKQHYSAGRYDRAIASFKAAAALRSSPILEFNIARCYDKLGRARLAIAAYERYLSGAKDAANAAEVRARVEALKKELVATARHDHPQDPYEDLESAPKPASAPASRVAVAPPPGPIGEEPGAPPAIAPRHEAAAGAVAQPPPPAPAPRLAARPPVRPTPAPPPAPPRRDEGPFYKQWWFWVACAGGVVIAGFVIGVAATSHSEKAHRSGLQISF